MVSTVSGESFCRVAPKVSKPFGQCITSFAVNVMGSTPRRFHWD